MELRRTTYQVETYKVNIFQINIHEGQNINP